MDTFAEQQPKESGRTKFSFLLFVISEGDNSVRARENLERLCRKWLHGRYRIKVVDVVEDFQTALDHNILLTPSVVVVKPEPRKIIHGDLSEEQKFVETLNLYDEGKDDR